MAASGYYYWIYRLDHDRFVPARCSENITERLGSESCLADDLSVYSRGVFRVEIFGNLTRQSGNLGSLLKAGWHPSELQRSEFVAKRKNRTYDRLKPTHPFVLGPFSSEYEPLQIVKKFHEELVSNFGYMSTDLRLANISHMEDVLEGMQFNTSTGRKILRFLLARKKKSSCTVLFQIPVGESLADDFYRFDCTNSGKIMGKDRHLSRYLAELVLTILYNFGGVLTIRDILPIGTSRLLSTGQSLTIPRNRIKSLRFFQSEVIGLNAHTLRESYSFNANTGKPIQAPKNYIFMDSSDFASEISRRISLPGGANHL